MVRIEKMEDGHVRVVSDGAGGVADLSGYVLDGSGPVAIEVIGRGVTVGGGFQITGNYDAGLTWRERL